MADTIGALRAQRGQLHTQIRALEAVLGSETTNKDTFIASYGEKPGLGRYEDWRKNLVKMLHRLKARDEELKGQLADILRVDGAVELFRALWDDLDDQSEKGELRERVRVFVRDTYGVFFKDPHNEPHP